MCRFHQVCGLSLMAFGLGVVVGLWLEGGFFCFGFGLLMILVGLFIWKSRRV